MTKFLASITSPEEAALALAAGVDLIDVKDPSSGALGALPVAAIRAIVCAVGGRRPVSATIGDLPPDAEPIAAAVESVAATGVDYVKIGLFGDGIPPAGLAALAARISGSVRLVAVMFADGCADFALVRRLAEAGFAGVMLDTAQKSGIGLRDCLDDAELRCFVTAAGSHGLMSGLAGSLRAGDVAALVGLGPDILGFRGALCHGGDRRRGLDPAAIGHLRGIIPADHPGATPSTAAMCLDQQEV